MLDRLPIAKSKAAGKDSEHDAYFAMASTSRAASSQMRGEDQRGPYPALFEPTGMMKGIPEVQVIGKGQDEREDYEQSSPSGGPHTARDTGRVTQL